MTKVASGYKHMLCAYTSTILLFLFCTLSAIYSNAQGAWTPLVNIAPDENAGVMILLTDGTVLTKTVTGPDNIGNVWNKLTPDTHGSYVNGTWTTIAPMYDTRLYFSSQVLKDGRLYVAGGEYGTGAANGEVYDPLTDAWTPTSPLLFGDSIFDGNSEILPDGKVLQGIVYSGGYSNQVYDPFTNTYSPGADCLASHDEASWVKLKDSSILFVDFDATSSERYIPSTNSWVADASLPVALYDDFIRETGPGFLLPDGRAFFIGATGHTAYYTPSGNTSPGTWVAGPDVPDSKGAPDAAGAMMVNGKILCAVSDTSTDTAYFRSPMSFYVFDYLANSFTHILAPTGDDTLTGPCYYSNMLNLPDGSILFCSQGSFQYYTYKPTGSPLAVGKPIIDSVIKLNCDTFKITGKLFNGISEGSCYGDDWQMATNYPLVRLTLGTNVYYARTWNWNRTGVMTVAAKDTAFFALPAAIPTGTYSLELVVNGNPSAPHTFKTCGVGVEETFAGFLTGINVYPNPANDLATVTFGSRLGGNYSIKVTDLLGRVIMQGSAVANNGKNSYLIHTDDLSKGVYTITVQQEVGSAKTKLVID